MAKQPDKTEEAEESPVSQSNAQEAIARIVHMRSVEELQHIVDNDKRITVAEAASKRLAELAAAKPEETQAAATPEAPPASPEEKAADKEVKQLAADIAKIEKSVDIDALEKMRAIDKRGPILDATQKRIRVLANEQKKARAKAAFGFYQVTLGELKATVKARDADEAWALFNDAHKTAYGPKSTGRSVVKLPDEAVA